MQKYLRLWIIERNLISTPLGLPARYMLQDGQLMEIQRIDCRDDMSWFIDSSVQKGKKKGPFHLIDQTNY